MLQCCSLSFRLEESNQKMRLLVVFEGEFCLEDLFGRDRKMKRQKTK